MLAKTLKTSLPMLVTVAIIAVLGGSAAWKIADLTDEALPEPAVATAADELPSIVEPEPEPAAEQAQPMPQAPASDTAREPAAPAAAAIPPARPAPAPTSNRVSGSNSAVILSAYGRSSGSPEGAEVLKGAMPSRELKADVFGRVSSDPAR
jgi:hypothetical protein